MELIIQDIASKIISSYEKEIESILTEGKDISHFILEIEKTLKEIGVTLVAEALETINQAYKNSKERKKHWVVKEKEAPKTLLTLFGGVNYKRTYYRNKKTGEYSYLSDEAVGIRPHDRLDASLKAKLIETAIFMPYEKSAQQTDETIGLTSQTVMNSIRGLGSINNAAAEIKQDKKPIRVLYIEADEDHVALQNGSHTEPKLVYVHEGKQKIGKNRFKLINPRYFSGIYRSSDELWVEVLDYIDKAYEMDSIEKIYLSGDGASWIKNGLGWIKGSIYVLDRYHLSKYVTQATAHMGHTTPIMWNYINAGDKKSVKDLFRAIIKTTEPETKRKAVQEARGYILGNWDGIMRQYDEDYIGCSAEGHVSHILSSRLSSRPLGWCKIGVDQRARLRAFAANGGRIYELFMERKKETANAARMLRVDDAIRERRKSVKGHETIGNVAILNSGKRTRTFQLLRAVRNI